MSVDQGFIEEHQSIAVAGSYDVVILGGGIAGTAAAIAAARGGCSTLLVEKSVMLGGLATLGLIAIYLPLCDGRGRKIIGGIAEELLQLSIKYGYDNLPAEWRSGPLQVDTTHRYQTVFSPPEFVLALDELVVQEGVTVLFDTVFSRPVMEKDRCTAVVVENKSGRTAYAGTCFIDATGDADLAFRAGFDCTEGDNWLSYWLYGTSLELMKKTSSIKLDSAIRLEQLGGDNTGRGVPDGARTYRGTDAWEVTEFIIEGRRLARNALLDKRDSSYSYLALPGMAQFRTTRRIDGRYTLTGKDNARSFPDSIGSVCDWRKRGPVYEIPYRCLMADRMENVLVAGRCIAADGEAWEICRVIPPAALTGQAAGTAAALAVRKGCSVQAVNIENLQQRLSDTGVRVHTGGRSGNPNAG